MYSIFDPRRNLLPTSCLLLGFYIPAGCSSVGTTASDPPSPNHLFPRGSFSCQDVSESTASHDAAAYWNLGFCAAAVFSISKSQARTEFENSLSTDSIPWKFDEMIFDRPVCLPQKSSHRGLCSAIPIYCYLILAEARKESSAHGSEIPRLEQKTKPINTGILSNGFRAEMLLAAILSTADPSSTLDFQILVYSPRTAEIYPTTTLIV